MCGIVGYVGPRDSQAILLAGLRGSSTAATTPRGSPSSTATAPRDGEARRQAPGAARRPRGDPPPDGTTGIGHTRWATHGGPTDRNAHPHLADDDKLAVIHNGIIENFSELKAELLAEGYTFRSETDTEVAAVLLGREYRRGGDLVAAFRSTVVAPRRRLHPARDARGPPRPRRRRPPQLAARDRPRRGRELPRLRRRRVRRAHPQRAGDRPGPDRRDHPRRRHRHRLRGQPRRGRALRGRVGRLGRRQGRLVELHGQGGVAKSPRPSRTRSAAASATGRSSIPELDGVRRAVPRHPAHHRSSRAAPPPTRAWSASTRSSSGRACRSTSSSRTSSATATR